MAKRLAACLLVILCLMGAAFAETKVGFTWGSKTTVNGVEVTPAILTVPLRNCVGMEIHLSLANATGGSAVGTWMMYGKDRSGAWRGVDTFVALSSNTTAVLSWDEPRELYAICFMKVNQPKLVKCTQTLQIKNPVYASSASTASVSTPTVQPPVQSTEDGFTLDDAWAAVVGVWESAVDWCEDVIQDVKLWWRRLSDETKPLVVVVAALVLYEIISHFWRARQRRKEKTARLAAQAQPTVAVTQPTASQQNAPASQPQTVSNQPTSNFLGDAVAKGVGSGVGTGLKYLLSKIDFGSVVALAVSYVGTAASAAMEWVNNLSEGMKLVVLVVVALVINNIVSMLIHLIRRAFRPQGK